MLFRKVKIQFHTGLLTRVIEVCDQAGGNDIIKDWGKVKALYSDIIRVECNAI